MTELKIGDNAPELFLEFSDTNKLSLKDYAGKFLVLYFYPKDNTPGCTVEAKEFNDLLPEFKELNAEIIGISRDDLKSHGKFCNKHGLKVKLGSDLEGNTCTRYGTWVEKSMYGKKYMGINRSTFLINPAGKIEYIWLKVSVFGHAREVLNKIKERI